MSDIDSLGARIDALEMRVAEQDRTIEDLNATIIGQWKEIEKKTEAKFSVDPKLKH